MRPALPIALALPLLIAAGVHLLAERHLRLQVAQAAQAETKLPRRVLWIWERPEDLHDLEPSNTAIAILRQTLHLGLHLAVGARRQPIIIPPGISQIAVVRIETDRTFAAHSNDDTLLQATVAQLRAIAWQPGIAALQIDFDAKRPEHAFYRRLLSQFRQQMPPGLPLEITALVSWCSTDDWIGSLPVNAAIPMFFRMEPDQRRLAMRPAPAPRLQEPLCASSMGVSTMEPWPSTASSAKRLYIFSDRGWAQDLPTLPSTSLPVTAATAGAP